MPASSVSFVFFSLLLFFLKFRLILGGQSDLCISTNIGKGQEERGDTRIDAHFVCGSACLLYVLMFFGEYDR